jgi:predicted DNA-binding transcriptional regulator AlpA
MPTHTIGRDLPPASVDAETVYLNAAQVRSRYGGMSDMALWRWLQDDDLGFPKPFRINRRRFWKASDLTAWERTRRSPVVDEAA